jgi:hypothetical protein
MICTVIRAATGNLYCTAWDCCSAAKKIYGCGKKAVSNVVDPGWFFPSRIPDLTTKEEKGGKLPFYHFHFL